MTTWKLKSFQSRILLFFFTIFFVVLVITNILVWMANARNAHEIITDDLQTASNIFQRLMETRRNRLADAARLLSGDYAFKTVFATDDRGTILSALENHRRRINADVMMLVSSENKLLVSTNPRDTTDTPFKYPELVRTAEDEGEAISLLMFGGNTYQAVVVPLLAPTPVAWILLGFKINDETALDFKKLANLEVSFFQEEGSGNIRCFASTIPDKGRGPLLDFFNHGIKRGAGQTIELPVMGNTYISLPTELGKTPDGLIVYAVLQRSLNDLMKPFLSTQRVLLVIAGIGLLCAALAAVFVARSVSKPVKALVDGVKRVEKGDYTGHVHVEQQDEIGTLAIAINHMTDGLKEKDMMRNLLGKVVSHAVAEELLSKKVELGGEEREVTILFSDIRGFTALSEFRSPKEVLSFLNVYLTRMSAIIEAHGGVVDKYIGDAIMALFGAPLKHHDDADRALAAAIEMVEALEGINNDMESHGMPRLDMGIGVNTGMVMAGNMGSNDRLNYTVLGDAVNIASRLQGLTRNEQFQAKIIISEWTLGKSKERYMVKNLGKAEVKGKSLAIAIYALLGKERPPA